MAALIAQNPALASGGEEGREARRLKAGSAEIEYFQAKAAGQTPRRVLALLGPLLSNGGGRMSFKPYSGGVGAERCPDSCENGLNGPLG